jgi:hypothetical protein
VLAKAGLTPVGPAHHYGEDVELGEATSANAPRNVAREKAYDGSHLHNRPHC